MRAAALSLLLVLTACGAPIEPIEPPLPPLVNARTCASITASFDTTIAGLSITCDEFWGTFTLASTGVPSYESNQTTPNPIRDQMWMVKFPIRPELAEIKRDAIASRGPIGFMINGVPFYGPQNAFGGDAIVNESATFDDCTGHADPGCRYHYHAEPICIAAANEPDDHPGLIGYALDGFALYGHDPNNPDLDPCNGHADELRGYHYHATLTFPYLLGCFAGTPAAMIAQVPACMRGR